MSWLKFLFGVVDRWQRRNRIAGAAWGVVKKFSNDNANLLVVGLGWYGFTAIVPLLLVVIAIFGFIGEKSLGASFLHTLHQFPVVGPSFSTADSSHLHGSALGLAIGLAGLLYGAQGVTQTAQQAMASVWNIPQVERTGFVPRLGRSLLGLAIIGLTFLINAFGTGYATGAKENIGIRIVVIAGLLVLNIGLYYASFRVLTAKVVPSRPLLPGAIAAAVGFTLLITVGTGLITHQLKNANNTYGTFGSVIGIVTFLLLLAKLTIYAAELNPVLHRRLYPRAMPFGEATEADRRVLTDLAHEEQLSKDEDIGVEFDSGDGAAAAPSSRRDGGSETSSQRDAAATSSRRDGESSRSGWRHAGRR